jgi:hypothetical protein
MITWRARAHQQCDSVLLLAYQTNRIIPERAGALAFVAGGGEALRQAVEVSRAANWPAPDIDVRHHQRLPSAA